MQRNGAMSWFGSWPLATAVTAAVVMGLAALVETTVMVGPEVRTPRPAPQPAPPLAPQHPTLESPRFGAIDMRAPAARFGSRLVESLNRSAVEHRPGRQAGRRTALRFQADREGGDVAQRLVGRCRQRDARAAGRSNG
jgi:hypothetical protein